MLERQTNQLSGSFSCGLGNRCCELSELLKPVLMLASWRKGQERVKSQNPRWLGVKEWDIGRTEQYAKRRHYGEVQRWEEPLNWPGGLSLPDTSQAVKKHPSTSCSVLRAGSLNTHSWDSNVKNCISQTLLHPSKGGLDFKISFGGGRHNSTTAVFFFLWKGGLKFTPDSCCGDSCVVWWLLS